MVINALENGGSILKAYLPKEKSTANRMIKHALKLKERLIETIAENHPSFPSQIEEYKYKACISFLSNFIDEGSTVYTLNYDLLLYWTLMYGMGKKLIKVIPIDGFGRY